MIISLLTDFGTEDYFVGAMKGVIMSINRKATIVDISHQIPPQDILTATFTLQACYKNFPESTVFAAVVDPEVGSNRRAIIVETSIYKFVAPDNGLLSFIFNTEHNFRVFEIQNEDYWLKPVSKTFHGRDIFAPVAAHLSKGIEAEKIGGEITDFVRIEQSLPKLVDPGRLEGQIIHIDHFGNLVTNLTIDDLPKNFSLKIRGRTIKNSRTFYSESAEDEIFIILGSAGYFEVVSRLNSAKVLLGAELNDLVIVKIF